MKRETITTGTEISSLEGKLVITGYNGHIVYVDEYTLLDEGEYKFNTKRMLTLNEIAHEMKEVDGLNYKVIWED